MRAQLIERTHTFCTFKLFIVRRTEDCSQARNPALGAQPSVVVEQINTTKGNIIIPNISYALIKCYQ